MDTDILVLLLYSATAGVITFFLIEGYIKLITVNAASDLYRLLSYHLLSLHEVFVRIKQDECKALKKYLTNRLVIYRMPLIPLPQPFRREVSDFLLLLDILQRMKRAGLIEVKFELCTSEWLSSNRHRFTAVPREEQIIWVRRIMDYETAEGSEKAEKKMLLVWVILIRKKPTGKRNPPSTESLEKELRPVFT